MPLGYHLGHTTHSDSKRTSDKSQQNRRADEQLILPIFFTKPTSSFSPVCPYFSFCSPNRTSVPRIIAIGITHRSSSVCTLRSVFRIRRGSIGAMVHNTATRRFILNLIVSYLCTADFAYVAADLQLSDLDVSI